MKCCACDVEMEPRRTVFSYLDHEMYHHVLRCPQCGQVYLPEELVAGKVKDVEIELEDK